MAGFLCYHIAVNDGVPAGRNSPRNAAEEPFGSVNAAALPLKTRAAPQSHRENRAAMSTHPAATPQTSEVSIAHSPDSDDAFMFYALATGKLRVPGLKFTHVLSDIESLNHAAQDEKYDVTAVSVYAYPFIADKYILLDCGASFGEGYGPIVVAAHAVKKTDLKGRKVAIPGTRTTSYLALKLFEPGVETVTMPFDKILDAVAAKEVEAGLLIHEGQLLYAAAGLHKVVDLGLWWQQETSLPLPLGANAIRRSLGEDLARQVAGAIRGSVSYALEHREEALNYALQFAREMDPALADKFVGMYVNRWTLNFGEEGRRAVNELISRAKAAGLLPASACADFLRERRHST
ncbi:MAG TPA: MqnA/MqnD/SBP family protein [Candidatus Acidoferrales bacterium]|nr:MqnA/MqnD/SBP family protein [Candidatus Acidoferrales bacterium]